MRIFDLDSKFMQYANKFSDLMFVNIVALICCIPIFTIGASITAMHYVVLAIYRDEESYVIKSFFKSFKQNFKQATLIWLIYLGVFILLSLDFWLFGKGYVEMAAVFKYALVFVSIIVAFSFVWVFILQSRYDNKILNTIKNSFIVGTSHFLYSVMMIILMLLPIVALYFWNASVPLVCMLGMTIPALLQAMLYSRVFDRMEGVDRKAEKEVDDGWTVELEEEVTEENAENLLEEVPTEAEKEQVDEQS